MRRDMPVSLGGGAVSGYDVREGRHLEAGTPPHQRRPGDRAAAVARPYPVERRVEAALEHVVGEERQLELLGASVDEPGDRDAEEGAAALVDERPRAVEEPPA